MLEGVLEKFCFPELQGGQNPNPILEWRAIWTLGRYWGVKWKTWGSVLMASNQVWENAVCAFVRHDVLIRWCLHCPHVIFPFV